MARIARNVLTIVPLGSSRWRLQGYVNGKRIREQGEDVASLENRRDELQRQVTSRKEVAVMRHTWLSVAQLRDAESAVQRANGRGLLECVIAAEKVLGSGDPIECKFARDEWLNALASWRRFPRTIEKNTHRLDAFLKACSAKYISDVTPEAIERYVLRAGLAVNTQVADGSVIRAWLNYCVKRRWLRESPFEMDLNDLRATSGHVENPKILTPEQSHALLRAARDYREGIMVPYVVLGLWCFMRSAEATRTRADQMKLDGKDPAIEVLPRKRGTVSYRAVSVPENVLGVSRAIVKKWPATKEVLDKKTKKKTEVPFTVPYSRGMWDAVRERAGLLQRGEAKNGRRPHVDSDWQENLLRHTGISYFYQKTKDIRETCRQAGTGDDTAFRHYLRLPRDGDEVKFYAAD